MLSGSRQYRPILEEARGPWRSRKLGLFGATDEQKRLIIISRLSVTSRQHKEALSRNPCQPKAKSYSEIDRQPWRHYCGLITYHGELAGPVRLIIFFETKSYSGNQKETRSLLHVGNQKSEEASSSGILCFDSIDPRLKNTHLEPSLAQENDSTHCNAARQMRKSSKYTSGLIIDFNGEVHAI